jgi:7,8-dihydropterin-6-yl-methyl-4-(beta-D-ribofuranosyl)aminobenzene 5'-phosphate synthase
MHLTVLCENFAPMSFGIIGEHGFSALIESEGKTLLFDTGQGLGLLSNAKLLGKNLNNVEAVALSHGHSDHTGGLAGLIRNHKARRVIAHPGIFDKKMAVRKIGDKIIRIPIGLPASKEELEKMGVIFQLTEKPMEIIPGVWFSGEVPAKNDFEFTDPDLRVETPEGLVADPFRDDAALFIKTDKGLTIVSGCAHRGIINTIDYAREFVGDIPIFAVIGGFHLHNADQDRVNKTIEALKNMGPQIVSGGHCTGQDSAFILREGLRKSFRFMSIGQRFEL